MDTQLRELEREAAVSGDDTGYKRALAKIGKKLVDLHRLTLYYAQPNICQQTGWASKKLSDDGQRFLFGTGENAFIVGKKSWERISQGHFYLEEEEDEIEDLPGFDNSPTILKIEHKQIIVEADLI